MNLTLMSIRCIDVVKLLCLKRAEIYAKEINAYMEDDALEPRQSQQAGRARPQVEIIRPSQRRKFLVGALSGVTLAAIVGSGWDHLAQNIQVALNTKDYPYHIWDNLVGTSFSPNLNLMGMTRTGNEDTTFYVWDYQQQNMTTFSTGSSFGDPDASWSPDNRYFVFQTENSLDLWEMATGQKISSYTGSSYSPFSKIQWSRDGSQLALLSSDGGDQQTFSLLDATTFITLTSFSVSPSVRDFAWSDDKQKVAFLNDDEHSPSWSITIRESNKEIGLTFQGQEARIGQAALTWSPNGTNLAVLARNQLHVLQFAETTRIFDVATAGNSALFAWSRDGRYLAVNTWQVDAGFGGAHNTFCVWDAIQHKIARTYERDADDEPQALAWSSDGKRILLIAQLYRQENWPWP